VSRISIVATGLLALVLLVPTVAGAQPAASDPGPAAAAQDPVTPPQISPAQIERIQRALNQPPGLKLTDQQLRFYLEIVARQPTFADYARGYDFLNGPTRRGNPMSHQEFVRMVTPKEMYSSAGITATEQLQLALTNYVGQSLIRKALEELRQARDAQQIEAIRERIDRELDALTGAARSTTR
jgi:hypothetical protein